MMDEVKFLLTQADKITIEGGDDIYINAKGAKLYGNQLYSQAVEYYRLGAAMGNLDSVSNLGYCYLYGRDIPQDTALAIAYFKIASEGGNPDTAYKLGDIYSRDKWGLADKELSIYYYSLAMKYIIGSDCNCMIIFIMRMHYSLFLAYVLLWQESLRKVES